MLFYFPFSNPYVVRIFHYLLASSYICIFIGTQRHRVALQFLPFFRRFYIPTLAEAAQRASTFVYFKGIIFFKVVVRPKKKKCRDREK